MHSKIGFAVGKHRRFLTQSQAITSFPKLRGDYDRLMTALSILEVVDATIQDEVEDGLHFQLVLQGLHHVESSKSPAGVAAWFHLRLMEMEGVLPDWSSADVASSIGAHSGEVGPVGSYFGHGEASDIDPKVLVTLERLAELDEPPEFVKLGLGAFAATTLWWEAVLSRRLSVSRSVLGAASLGE